ncbi:hypothetical protein R1flu_011872 [Riccia fluitans]|uniref:Protein kinase domain-containing protein n=1 Tax=Riccia fluitans TaxID=41844 RepID=A0ABD1Z9X7_9MARC
MAENVSLHVLVRLLQSLVLMFLSQLVVPGYGQKTALSGDMRTMLKVRDDLLGIPENKVILQDWSSQDNPCNWTRVDCEEIGISSVVVRRIDLNHRNLTGPVPPSIGLLLNLTDITADGNQFSSIPQGFFQAKQLRLISFRNNLISGKVLDKLTTFQSLRVLQLGQNLISGRVDPLARLNRSAVEVIDLSGNSLQGSLTTFSGFSRLVSLRLGRNQLTGDLGTLEELTSINDVSLEENNFNGTIPTSIISRMSSVNLSRNSLRGTFTLREIFVPGFITTLDLSENRIQQVAPEFQSPGNQSTTESALDFFWARGVRKITLGGNGLSGSIVSFPESASTFNLSHNMLSGNLPEDTRATFYANVETLLLNNNSLTGPVPKGFWNMEKAATMDLSGNQFTGALPGGAIIMPSLQALNLSRNTFSGPIPAEISNLMRNFNLRTVDLSFNNFSGPLPRDFPQGENYTYLFTGNPGLCTDDDFFRKENSLTRCSKPSRAAVIARWAGAGSSLGVVLLLTTVSLCLWRLKVVKDNEMDEDLVRAVNSGLISTRLIPLKELEKATSNFAEETKIGEGGFGSVYRGFLEGKKVAIKKSSDAVLHLVQGKQMFMNEVQILSGVNHPSLVSLVGCCMTKKHALLVFEYVPQGTLAEHLYYRRGEGLDWNQRLKIARQTANALSYLHFMADPPIYHRDVKSANILLDDELNAKVADFGISKVVPYQQFSTDHISTTTGVEGTPGYVDPEYYVNFRLTDKSDVYSFGVVLLELITSRAPLDFRRGERDNTLVKMATNLLRTNALHLLVDPMLMIVFDDNEDVKKNILSVAELALRCVHRLPLNRPDMQQVAREIEALSSVQFHVGAYKSTMEEEDMDFIWTAYPAASRGSPSPYERATGSSGSMEFRFGFGR